MRRMVALTAALALLTLFAPRAQALDVGSDGLSGTFNPVSSVQIDLSLAITGDLSTPGNVNGVYDPVRWAVIFKYASVNIPAGVTVTFKNHPSGAPVVWLVQGNTTINGLVSLDGSASNSLLQQSPGGPGGFAGGKGPYYTVPAGAGSGPGGGQLAGTKSGSYGTLANTSSSGIYGSPEIFPLVGGSGGAGGNNSTWSGTGGGGAILLACNGIISLGATSTTQIQANGTGSYCGAGSGGAIRLLATSISGAGFLLAVGGPGNGSSGGLGRIRVEANSMTIPAGSSPAYSVVSPLTGSEQIFPPISAPTIRVSAINGIPVSATPNGEQTIPTDINLTVQAPVQVDLISANVPSGSAVTLRVVPFEGPDQTYTAAANGPDAWRALNVALPASGVASMVARAVLP